MDKYINYIYIYIYNSEFGIRTRIDIEEKIMIIY